MKKRNIKFLILIITITFLIKSSKKEIKTKELFLNYDTEYSIPLIKTKFASIEIPEINLSQELNKYNSVENNVNKSIEILFPSIMPDKLGTTLILAAHSGNSKVSFFKDLNKLHKKSLAIINYKDINYMYEVVKIENQIKNGNLNLKIVKNQNNLVLTTCNPNDKTKQLVVYLKLTHKI